MDAPHWKATALTLCLVLCSPGTLAAQVNLRQLPLSLSPDHPDPIQVGTPGLL